MELSMLSRIIMVTDFRLWNQRGYDIMQLWMYIPAYDVDIRLWYGYQYFVQVSWVQVVFSSPWSSADFGDLFVDDDTLKNQMKLLPANID